MTRNEELIRKYKRYIKKMEKQIETLTAPQALPLIAKISVYKMVIIDLQEQLKKFVLAQKKIKSETVETYYKKLKNNEKRNKIKSNVQ